MSSLLDRFAGLLSHWGFSRDRPFSHDRPMSHEEVGLREQLQREAGAERPQFSANLHRQLCQAVRHVKLHAPPDPTATLDPATALELVADQQHEVERESGWSFSNPMGLSHRIRFVWRGLNLGKRVSLATVVILVFAGWAISTDSFWNLTAIPETNLVERTNSIEQRGNPATSLAMLSTLPDQAVVQIEQWIVSSLANERWAYLEHDARLVSEWLVEDLPWKVPAVKSESEISDSNT